MFRVHSYVTKAVSRTPPADAVETDPRGILFYWKSKKLERYDVNTLYFAPLRFSRKGMVRSSFNIQYQSTGIGSLSLLVEIEPRRSIRGVFSCNIDTF